MKRMLWWLLIMVVPFSLFGCKGEGPVYEEPVFTPGTLESDLLKVEDRNFDRANRTGGGIFLEIETGYYYSGISLLMYAEKTDIDSWYYVCTKPNCSHGSQASSSNSTCAAQIACNELVWNNNRIYTVYDIHALSQLRPSRDSSGLALLSMKKSGENTELVHHSEAQQLSNGGWASSCLFPDTSYLLNVLSFNPDGSYTERLIFTDRDRQERVLLERSFDQQPGTGLDVAGRSYSFYGINGDISFVAATITNGMGYSEPLCWIQDGEMVITDIAGLPGKHGYLHDGILRGFASGDGYYDTNLLTGEQVRLADAQLSDSAARILQPNCILESTLFDPETAAQAQRMRFFDGQSWHEVELPEKLRNTADPTFEVVALTSDKVIFKTVYNANGRSYEYHASTVTFYEMPLEGDYSLSCMGTVQRPQEEE